VTVVEAERQYEAIITMRAGNLGITAQSLRSLIRKMQKVRERKLKRVEVRACGVGAQEALMKSLKAFFGCGKFLAPKAETFYLPKTSVDVIASGSGAPAFKGWEPDPRFRVRDPGIRVGNPIVEMRKLSGRKPRARPKPRAGLEPRARFHSCFHLTGLDAQIGRVSHRGVLGHVERVAPIRAAEREGIREPDQKRLSLRATLREALRIQPLQRFRHKSAVFADQLPVEVDHAAAVVGPLDADHVPMNL
jgi:hypothetical protein